MTTVSDRVVVVGRLVYREFRMWSPTLGCEAARISLVDGDRGGEYWRVVPVDVERDGKRLRWSEWRAEVLEDLTAAIEAGAEPGEVK